MIPKKRIYLYILLVCISILSMPRVSRAVPAAPAVHTLKQADGSHINARQWGDENLHGWETEEGLSIVFDDAVKSWAYASHSVDGDLVSSSKIVGRDSPAGISQYLRPKGEALNRIYRREPSKVIKARSSAALTGLAPEVGPAKVVPPTGTANIPVILVNFSNTSTTYSNANFNSLLFGTGNFSMKDYYQEVSYGTFSVSPGPWLGVAGWYQASKAHDYYGADSQGSDAWPGDLVYEAVRAADLAGLNFAAYDQDGDCYVDVVNIVHQGTGQEAGGPATDIWSHSWSLSGALFWGNSNFGTYTTNDPCPSNPSTFIKVDDYVVQPEVLGTIQHTMGVFAHEYGHALGLPDLYDTDYTSSGVGSWSLMAGGSWNGIVNSGDRPAHMDAWSKYFLGWITPLQVSGTMVNEAVTQAATAADVYQLLPGSPSGGGEYFLVENRQKTGFDAGLPGAGLLIWHIDESKNSNNNECYPGGPSCAAQHYHVALVQADNLWELEKGLDSGDTGDPFPGSTTKTTFNITSSPNSNLHNGSPSNVSVTSIGASASTMTATFTAPSNDPTAPVPGTVTPSNTQFGSFVDSPFDLTTNFTDNETNVTSCEYTVNGSTWLSAVVSGASPVFTCTKTGIAATNGQILTLNMRAVSGGGTGTAAPVTRTVDSTAPVTSINTTSAWLNISPVSVILTPSDSAGSGVSSTRYCLDATNTCTPASSGTSVSVICGAGSSCTQYVRYFSSDNVGNTETVKSGQIRQDLAAPTGGTLTAVGFNREVLLSWTGFADTGSGLNGTNAYSLVRNTGTYPNNQCSNGTQIYLGNGTNVTDSGLSNGVTYYYRVCARDTAGNISAGSTAAATPDTSTWQRARNSYYLLPERWLLSAFSAGSGPYSIMLMVIDETTGNLISPDQIQGPSLNPLLITSAAQDRNITLVFDDILRTAYLFHDNAGAPVLTDVADIKAVITGTPVLSAPASLLFGTVSVNTTKDLTAVVSNTGTAPLRITSVSSPSAPFTKATDGCNGVTVAPSGTCSIVIRFAPAAAAIYNSSFSISSDGGNAAVQLQGTGTSSSGPGF